MMKNRRLVLILLILLSLLLIPLTAMQFSDEVNWSMFDFVLMGSLLAGVGLACELVFRKFKKTEQRIGICVVIVLIFLLFWAELAVGVFGSPFAGN